MTRDLEFRNLFFLRPLARELMHSHRLVVKPPQPNGRSTPFFVLVRGTSDVTWGVRNDVAKEIADELGRLASEEPPVRKFEVPPLHAEAYLSLVRGQILAGPAFGFPDEIAQPTDIALVDRLDLLEHHFRGWTAEEIPWCSPIVAVMEGGYPVSVCFCATRNSESALEAGVETATAFRGRGFATRVTKGWACAIRASGQVPLYSTDWSNTASLAVARKLGLIQYASDWSLVANIGTRAG
jgi:hypothetical protein